MSTLVQNRLQKAGYALVYPAETEGMTLLEMFGLRGLIYPSANNPDNWVDPANFVGKLGPLFGVPDDFIEDATVGMFMSWPLEATSAVDFLARYAASAGDQEGFYRLATYLAKFESATMDADQVAILRGFLEGGIGVTDWTVRSQAAIGLGHLGGDESAALVASQLTDADKDVVADTLAGLAYGGGIRQLVADGSIDRYTTGDHGDFVEQALPYLLDGDLDAAEVISEFGVNDTRKARLLAAGATPSDELFQYFTDKLASDDWSTTKHLIEALLRSAPADGNVDVSRFLGILDDVSEGGGTYSQTQVLLGALPLAEDVANEVVQDLLSRDLSDQDAKKSRALAVGQLAPKEYSRCGVAEVDLLSFGYMRMETIIEGWSSSTAFDTMYGSTPSRKQRDLIVSMLASNQRPLGEMGLMAATALKRYPECQPFMEKKVVETSTATDVRKACASALLAGEAETDVPAPLLRSLLSFQGGPVAPSPENFGLLLALLNDHDTQQHAAVLLRSVTPEQRMTVRAFVDLNRVLGNNSTGLVNAGLRVGGQPVSYYDPTQLNRAIRENALLAVNWKEDVPSNLLAAIMDQEDAALEMYQTVMVNGDDRSDMEHLARAAGTSSVLTDEDLANGVLVLGRSSGWVRKEAAGRLAKAAGKRLTQAPQFDEVASLLVELTQDSDSDVERDSKAACAVLGIDWESELESETSGETEAEGA